MVALVMRGHFVMAGTVMGHKVRSGLIKTLNDQTVTWLRGSLEGDGFGIGPLFGSRAGGQDLAGPTQGPGFRLD